MDYRARTARANGAVGNKALAPNFIAEKLHRHLKGKRILDFGSGWACIHKPLLESKGMQVDCYDLRSTEQHVTKEQAMATDYDCVLVSNVFNVQRTEEDLRNTLLDLRKLTENPDTMMVFNIPASPRKLDMPTEQYEKLIQTYIYPRTLCKVAFRSGHVYMA